MSRLRSCPSCQYENSEYLTECRQCGTRLKSNAETTVSVFAIPVADTLRQAYLMRQTKVSQGRLALHIAGEQLPLILEDRDSVILGRDVTSQLETLVDLANYRAYQLGVSRQHATIHTSSEGDMTLEDLGSSNGTWLNGIRLGPHEPRDLQSGDLVQLGQLVLYVYVQEKPAEERK